VYDVNTMQTRCENCLRARTCVAVLILNLYCGIERINERFHSFPCKKLFTCF